VKEGWQTSTLGEILAVLRNGINCKQNKTGKGEKISRIESISDARFNAAKVGYAELSERDKARYLLQPGDILFSHINSAVHVGKTALFEDSDSEHVYHGVNLLLMRPKAILTSAFLDHTLKLLFQSGYWRGVCKQSVNQASVNQQDISRVQIRYPKSLAEQHRIVSILDEAFEGIAIAKANAEKNLENARALFESHLQNVFMQRGEDWDEKPLSELCDIKHGFAFKSEFFTDKGDYVVLTPGNFYESGGYRDRGEKQKYYSGEIPKGFILKKGDMLVAMTEQAAGLLGSPIIVPESDKFLHNQRLGLVNKKLGVPWTNEFFFHVFNTKAVRKEIHDSASGVKVRHTSPTKIGEVIVSFPTSVSEQRIIVSRLTDLHGETERLESIYKQKLAALDELKKSLLHKAFTGEL
jgi:type I restriction enzyme S subunit